MQKHAIAEAVIVDVTMVANSLIVILSKKVKGCPFDGAPFQKNDEIG